MWLGRGAEEQSSACAFQEAPASQSPIAPKFPLHTFSHALQDASAANAMAADRCARLSNTSQRSQTSSNPSGDLAGVGGVKGHQVILLVWVG